MQWWGWLPILWGAATVGMALLLGIVVLVQSAAERLRRRPPEIALGDVAGADISFAREEQRVAS